VITRWIEGRVFDNRGPEAAGGRGIELGMMPGLLTAIEELRDLDVAQFADPPGPSLRRGSPLAIPKVALPELVDAGLIRERDRSRIMQLLTPFDECAAHEPLMLTNADLQFQNLVWLADGRLAIIDWDGAGISSFEVEHCMSYQWLLMWNNPEWQRAFMRAASARFDIRPHRLRAVMLRSAIILVLMLRPKRRSRSVHLEQIETVISDAGYAAIVGG